MKLFPLVSRSRLNRAICERDEARAQRDAALIEKDAALAQRDAVRRARRPTEEIIRLVASFSLTDFRPLGVLRSLAEWRDFSASDICCEALQTDARLLAAREREPEWSLLGYSTPAEQLVEFKVDTEAGGRCADGRYFPNLPERFVCPVSNLNNRQRLMATLLLQAVSSREDCAIIYMPEQVTPFFDWARGTLHGHNVIGSEYLGEGHCPGAVIDGVRHEDLLNLSLADASVDIVVSNDVLEHIPAPEQSFRELARVLRPDGEILLHIPFFLNEGASRKRAELIQGTIVHHLAPEFHGNPVSPEGSLVFTDFGWDVLEMARSEGFASATVEIYHSVLLGHVGLHPFFRFRRQARRAHPPE